MHKDCFRPLCSLWYAIYWMQMDCGVGNCKWKIRVCVPVWCDHKIHRLILRIRAPHKAKNFHFHLGRWIMILVTIYVKYQYSASMLLDGINCTIMLFQLLFHDEVLLPTRMNPYSFFGLWLIVCRYRFLTFKRRIKSHLPFAGIIRSSPYSPRFQDNG